MAISDKMMRFAVFLAILSSSLGKEVGLRGSGHEVAPRQLRESKSCGDGMTVDVKPPWEDLDAHLEGASVESCKTCAESLESDGYLMSGWECYKSFWWGVYLKRDGDNTLAAVKPLQSTKIADMQGSGPFVPATDPLPKVLQGVFWLSDQKTQSALITFAPNNKADCEWCSYGNLILNRYLIRVSGDKVWSFATEASAGYDLAQGMRLLYDFSFDSATDPTYATIYPILSRLGSFGDRLSKQTWLLNFDMSLLSSDEAAALGYTGSVVWVRKTYAFGVEIESSRYYVVQVVDENGDRKDEAWNKFSAYQNSDEAGDQPGVLFYHGDD